MTKDKIRKIVFSPHPNGGHRFIFPSDAYFVLDSKTGRTLKDDKLDYPSKFENSFWVKILTNKILFEFEVEKDYRWNNADIFGIIQIFALCSKDDRRIILPSGIHDYMLEYKQGLYNLIIERYPDYSVSDYRKLTSEVFRYLCESQGFSKTKSRIMANTVDFFQKYFQKSKWKKVFKKSSLSL